MPCAMPVATSTLSRPFSAKNLLSLIIVIVFGLEAGVLGLYHLVFGLFFQHWFFNLYSKTFDVFNNV